MRSYLILSPLSLQSLCLGSDALRVYSVHVYSKYQPGFACAKWNHANLIRQMIKDQDHCLWRDQSYNEEFTVHVCTSDYLISNLIDN